MPLCNYRHRDIACKRKIWKLWILVGACNQTDAPNDARPQSKLCRRWVDGVAVAQALAERPSEADHGPQQTDGP
jgi:hypothetical protein